MSKIKVITDSSADITDIQAKELGIDVVRMPISLDDDEYIEAIDIDTLTFIRRMREGAVAKTSQASLGQVAAAWDKALEEYDEVIYVPISSGLSGAYASAKMLAETDYANKVTVIDVKSACYPLQETCRQIVQCIQDGKSSQEIKALFEEKSVMWAALIPEDMVYLKRGGRISSAAAALASLLKIYPILKVENGKIDVLDKVRTARKAHRTAIDACFENVEHLEDYRWLIVEADAMETALQMKKDAEEKYPVTFDIVPMHPIIMAHTGPGTIGIGRVTKVR